MSGPIDRPLIWLAFGLVLEAVVFYVHVQLQVAPYYPQVYDQLTYMWATTEILDNLSRHGLEALIQPFRSPMPTGITYPLQGALAQLVLGPGRAALLTVNLLYFLAAQFCLFLTVRRTHGAVSHGAVSVAWLALALFIGCIGIFKTAGGIADYRIDFAAMCLFGIWVCTLSLTNEFTSRKFSVLAGLVAGALVLLRFITAAYVGPIFIILFFYLVFWKRRDEPDYFMRIANILISGATAAVMVLPALALALGPIKAYYVNGHINGDEPAIRAADVGVDNLASNLLYYPKTLSDFQIGTVGAIVIVVALIVAVIGKLRSPNLRLGNSFDAFVFAVALLVPLAVLTCDYSKSPVVVGIVLIPLMLLIASIWYSFAIPHLGSAAIRWTTYFFLAVGAVAFVTNASSRRLDISSADQTEIQKLNLTIAASCADLERPIIAFDRLTDYLNGSTLRYYFRQQYGPNRPAPTFGENLAGIFTVPREQALSAIKSSDVVVLTDKTTRRGKGPFDTAIIEYWDAIDDFAERNLTPLANGTVNGIPYRVFVRAVSPERKAE
jgi:hypothetical protein